MKTRVFAVCVVVFLFFSIAHAGLSDGLVAYYPFNGNANDESGNGNNGTVNGATLSADRFGQTGKAYSFDGVDDNITHPTNGIKARYGTITGWVNPNVSNSWGLWQTHESCCNWSDWIVLFAHVENDPFYFRMGNGSSNCPDTWWLCNNDVTIAKALFPIGQWTHFAFTWDGTTMKAYIKAEIVATKTNAVLQDNMNSIAYIGLGHGHIMNGAIDDIRIYNRALSESEIQQLYNEGQVCPDVAVKPYTFTSGTSAKAAEVNADFNTLYQQINTQNCQIQALKAIVCQDHPTASVCQ